MARAAHSSAPVVIIGGGHNGLVCAAYLARAGLPVTVLEAATEVGGAAVTREFAPGFSVSACAHLLTQLHPLVVRDLKLDAHGLRLAARHLDTVALSLDGNHLLKSGNSVSGGDISGADRVALPVFQSRMQKFAALLGKYFAQVPPRLAGGTRRDTLTLARMGLDLRRMGRDDMREFLRVLGTNVYDVLQEQFDSELLKGLLGFDAVLGSHLGPRTPNSLTAWLCRLAVPTDGIGGAISVPVGGMGAVTQALAAAATAAGAVVRTSAPVARVLVEGGRATGVELDGGDTLAARAVVSSADPKTSFFKLIGARHVEAGFARPVHHIRMRGDAAKLHLALDGPVPFRNLDPARAGARLVIAPTLGYVERAFDASKYGEYSAEPAMEIHVPTALDSGLAPKGKHVLSAIVQYAPYALKAGWDSEREVFKARLIEQLCRYAPGLQHRIEHAELLVPPDLERRFRLGGGHWHHGELSFDQFMMMRPVPGAAQYAMPLDGFYLCGAGTHPGGGVMGLAGRNAAGEIGAKEKQPR
ncbi:MAG: NAD(P)/FAD-dependent oxidoreductase [Pseudomonadota bacterium]